MFKYLFILFIATKVVATQIEPFALFTIPKSGSHLLIKTLYTMTGFTPNWHQTPPDLELLLEQRRFPYTHCCLPPILLDYYGQSSYKQIIGIRDLRDVCVSVIYQIEKGLWPEFTRNPKNQKKFQNLSFDEKLLFVINQEYEIIPPFSNFQLGMRKVADQVCSLIQNPGALICRFEELVGSRGGGSDELQKKVVEQIATHIGLFLTPQEIEEIAGRLYGNDINPFGSGDFINYQSTFREGKIGSWRGYFKEVHKAAFKQRLGKQLILLGYEKDNNW